MDRPPALGRSSVDSGGSTQPSGGDTPGGGGNTGGSQPHTGASSGGSGGHMDPEEQVSLKVISRCRLPGVVGLCHTSQTLLLLRLPLAVLCSVIVRLFLTASSSALVHASPAAPADAC